MLAPDDDQDNMCIVHDDDEDGALVPKLVVLEEIATLLWDADYDPLFKVEFERNRALASRCGVTVQQLQLSTYPRRLTGDRLDAWKRQQVIRERDQLAIALHAANMRHWSPSLVARSIAYFTLTTSWMHRAWRVGSAA